MPTITVHRDEESWLAGRPGKLNASEVPALLGCYPSKASEAYKNPFALWRQKTGQAEPDDAEAMRLRFDLGHLVEDRVAQEVERREGCRLADLGDYTTVSEGILSATPDRMIVPAEFRVPGMVPSALVSEGDVSRETKVAAILEAATGTCELKSDGTIQEAGAWAEGGKFDHALVQLHVGMIVTGKEGGLLAALFGLGLGFEVWPVVRSAELVSLIHERSEEFWEAVLTGTPPSATFLSESEAIGRSLAQIYAKDSGEEIEFDAAAREQFDHHQFLKREVKRLKGEIDLIENQVRLKMGEATWARIPGEKKRWQWKVEPREGYTKTVPASNPRVLRVVKA